MGNKGRWSRYVRAGVIVLLVASWCGAIRAEEAPAPVPVPPSEAASVPVVAPESAPAAVPGPAGQDVAVPTAGSASSDVLGGTLPITAGWDTKNGFFLSDKDKQAFLLKVGGMIQARYTYEARDQRGSFDNGNDRDISDFEIERARVSFGGYVLHHDLTYFIQLDGDTDKGGGVELLDAYVQYNAGTLVGGAADALSVGVGQWKPYFLRQEATSSSKQQFVDRSLANEFFNIDRNLGVWVQGNAHPFFYAFAVTNGVDSANVSTASVDQIPAFVGKLDFAVLGKEGGKYEESNVSNREDPLWVVGASVVTDQDNGSSQNGSIAPFKMAEFGVDTIFKWSLFSLQAEYMGRWLEYEPGNTVPGLNGDGSWNYAHGFYAQGGVFLVPGTLEVAARVSAIWSDGPQDGDAWEAGPGLNWYISKSHNVKLSTDLMYFDISGGLPIQTENLSPASFSAFSSSAAGYQSGEQGFAWRTQLQLKF